MWLAPFLKPVFAAVTARLSLKSRSSHGSYKKDVLTSYFQVENHFLITYATDDIIAEQTEK